MKRKFSDGSFKSHHLHEALEAGQYVGYYGGCNAPFLALAEARANKDLHKVTSQRSSDEFLIEALDEYLKLSSTQKRWDDIVTVDPFGLWSTRPTISATTAHMYIEEMKHLPKDGTIVGEDGGISVIKCALDYAWNLPGLSSRLGIEEDSIRKSLAKYLQNPSILDSTVNVLLPPSGGATVYMFGDPRKLAVKSTEVAVRVHDECNGSDVFGTDICTCRPYLMFAIEGAVACAQRGGVGIIVYFRKEGRALGEVTKFRVYNARKYQKGGDRPEKYFFHTESIAGVRDARFQELMPDILLWLGISRIDWLLSMSSEKYDAIVAADIKVMQRISLPDELVPTGASVEITAKISAGYHTDTVHSSEVRSRLKGLDAIREQCGKVFRLAEKGLCHHFTMNLKNLPKTVDAVLNCIKKDYPSLDIPHHSRIRHFTFNGEDRLKSLTAHWHCDETETVRRIIDLVTVSVLLDAGAGPDWTYCDSKGLVSSRSEGLALASFDMFASGLFSSDEAMPFRVNSLGIKKLTLDSVVKGMQHSEKNPLLGIEGRYDILQNLAKALESNPKYFGVEVPRPGHIVDYVLSECKEKTVSVKVLWEAIVTGLEDVWPTTLTGVRRGDVWVYPPLKENGIVGSDMVPFHKLSQWLQLSMLEPLEGMGIKFTDLELITALAEYRNGGLFVDYGVLSLRDESNKVMEHPVGSELVVEWRALTVILVDLCAAEVRKKLGVSNEKMPVYKILEGGTWKAGRLIAMKLRKDGSPPIKIRSDGTVF